MRVEKIPLWAEKDYKYGTSTGFIPFLTGYFQPGNKKREAVIVVPGGSYSMVSGREGETAAMTFLGAGYHVFLLSYTVNPLGVEGPVQMQAMADLAKAVAVLRENSGDWSIESDKIGVCGFSAGGHLAGCLAVHWNHPVLREKVKGDIRPTGVILGYPLVSFQEWVHEESMLNLLGAEPTGEEKAFYSLECNAGQQMPPVFLWHSAGDKTIPAQHSLLLANRLALEKMPFEMHIFPEGDHGISVANVHYEKLGPYYGSPAMEQIKLFVEYVLAQGDPDHILGLSPAQWSWQGFVKKLSLMKRERTWQGNVSMWPSLALGWLNRLFASHARQTNP